MEDIKNIEDFTQETINELSNGIGLKLASSFMHNCDQYLDKGYCKQLLF